MPYYINDEKTFNQYHTDLIRINDINYEKINAYSNLAALAGNLKSMLVDSYEDYGNNNLMRNNFIKSLKYGNLHPVYGKENQYTLGITMQLNNFLKNFISDNDAYEFLYGKYFHDTKESTTKRITTTLTDRFTFYANPFTNVIDIKCKDEDDFKKISDNLQKLDPSIYSIKQLHDGTKVISFDIKTCDKQRSYYENVIKPTIQKELDNINKLKEKNIKNPENKTFTITVPNNIAQMLQSDNNTTPLYISTKSSSSDTRSDSTPKQEESFLAKYPRLQEFVNEHSTGLKIGAGVLGTLLLAYGLRKAWLAYKKYREGKYKEADQLMKQERLKEF